MSNLRDLYSFKITIGDAIVTDGLGSSFVAATIYESIIDIYSTCTIIFNGSEEFINTSPIVDGTPIKIFVQSKDLNFSYVYYYRVAKLDIVQSTNNSYRYIVYGYTDFYNLFEPPTNFAFFGKSSQVFKNIADTYNLENEIDNTNDEQLWVCSEQNLKEWLSFVSSRGWINETSGMFWCLDRHRCLLYKDISSLFNLRTEYTFAPGTAVGSLESKTIYYFNSVVSNKTAEENITNNGYGGSDFHFNLLEYKTQETSANKVKAFSNIININKQISKGLKQSFHTMDIGNMHENYFVSRDQNMRVLSTFSTYYGINCQFFYPVRLGQIVNLVKNSLTNGNLSKTLNLKALIYGIQITLHPTSVTMNVDLCTQGFNGRSTLTY